MTVFTIETQPGARSARLNLNGVFSANELEQLIGDLARARAMMQPGVPRDPEPTVEVQADPQHDPRFFVSEAPDHAGVVLRIRDPGAGWRAYRLPYNEAGRLGMLLDEWSRRRP
jgi:hypothetical protein